jgi:hypothetical protein
VGQLQAAHAELRNKLPAGVDISLILSVLGQFFWKWYYNNRGDTIVKRKILIFNVTIKVKDLKPLFVSLFGTPPADMILPGNS